MSPPASVGSADNDHIGGSRSEIPFALGNLVSRPDPDLAPVAPTLALKAGTSVDIRSPVVTYTPRNWKLQHGIVK